MAITTMAVNDVGDLYLVDGSNFGFLSGVAAIIQDIGQATKKVRGENQFNVAEGIDYFGVVFSPTPDYDSFRAQLIEAALSVPDTVDVTSVVMERDGDNLNYEMTVTTIYGSAEVNGAISTKV